METIVDYKSTGLNLCDAMLDMAKRHPEKAGRLDYILWNGLQVKTADCWIVPLRGVVRIEMLSSNTDIQQGVDLEVEAGALKLKKGEEVSLLRTWADTRYEDVVEYTYFSRVGRIYVWNVYKVRLSNGQLREEKWTGNAGFWVQRLSEHQRIYHCSHGMAVEPDFDLFTFRVSVLQL